MKNKPKMLDTYSYEPQIGENNENHNDENYMQQISGEINMEVDKKYMSFSAEQVQCICEALLQSLPIKNNDIERLSTFLYHLPSDDRLHSESIMRAKAMVAFHQAQYHELYNILSNTAFSPKYHPELHDLWFKGHYREAEKIRGRPLGAVDKYRLRKKYPLPMTIW